MKQCESSDDQSTVNHGTGSVGGDNFAPNGDGQNMARLCFAFETVEKNYEGIKEFASILKDLKAI